MSQEDRRPRWLRELERLAATRSMLVISGNVKDTVLYPCGPGEDDWTVGSLRQALFATLRGQLGGYDVLAAYNLLDGMVFADQDEPSPVMAQRFEQLLAAAESREAKPGSCRAPQPLPAEEPVDHALRMVHACLANQQTACAMIVEYSSQIAHGPTNLSLPERLSFLRLEKASRESQTVATQDETGQRRAVQNLLLLVVDRLTDLPAWLYLNNPFTATIEVEPPRSAERRHFFERFMPPAAGDSLDLDELVDLSDGLTIRELGGLRSLAARTRGEVTSAKKLVDRFKYGVTASEWDSLALERLADAEGALAQRVMGQPAAVRAVADVLRRARLHLSGAQHSSRSKPRGILFFAGPTGVGKTELAKAVAELVFNNEEACVRFDMSEYSQSHSDQRLLGAPPGYVGYEEGGQLTNQLRANPFRVLLFDEIEKAHPTILDKFLQILEDGRMTDGRGETVYFSESLAIFTSNVGIYQLDAATGRPLVDPETGRPRLTVDPAVDTAYDAVRDKVLVGVSAYFKHVLGRPELLNRIGQNVIVFDFVRPPVMRQILEGKVLRQIQAQVQDRWRLRLAVAPMVTATLVDIAGRDLTSGGRGIGNLAEAAILNPASRVIYQLLCDQGPDGIAGHELTIETIREEEGGRYDITWRFD